MSRLAPSTLGIAIIATVLGTLPLAASPAHWEPDIKRFEATNVPKPLPQGGVVFVGSSSIRMWKTLAEDFPGVPLVNHGFGGSEIADSVYYFDRIVLPYKPAVVVFYAGDNDIAAGQTPQQVLANFQTFRTKLKATLPHTKLIYLSIKECKAREAKRMVVREANRLIAADCTNQPNCTFVDMSTPLLKADGDFRSELFMPDNLHLNAAGYQEWTRVLMPYLESR